MRCKLFSPEKKKNSEQYHSALSPALDVFGRGQTSFERAPGPSNAVYCRSTHHPRTQSSLVHCLRVFEGFGSARVRVRVYTFPKGNFPRNVIGVSHGAPWEFPWNFPWEFPWEIDMIPWDISRALHGAFFSSSGVWFGAVLPHRTAPHRMILPLTKPHQTTP